MSKNQLKILDDLGLFNLPITSWQGREFISNGKKYIDYASTNYLGFDFDPHLTNKGVEYAQKWSSISGWSRMEVDPDIYYNLENRIAKFLNCQNVHLSHTITITGFSIIPSIVKKGIVFADAKVHNVVYEACRLAKDHGAQLLRFKHQDMNDLERLLQEYRNVTPKMIAVDGVYSISTELAPIRELQLLCEKYDAWLYVDDAHGFGILGENPNDLNLYGTRGNGVVNYFGGNFDRTFYVSSFGKAFCTYTAFATVPNLYRESVRASSMQYLFSAPPNPYIIGTVDAVLDLNDQRGEIERKKIREITSYFLNGLVRMNLRFTNELLQPVVYLEIGTLPQLVKVAEFLWAGGVIAGMRAYPVVPETQCGLRFALSSLHTQEHVDRVLNLLTDLRRDLQISNKIA
ncbi:MAG: hypothetical protein A4S09_09570 [Proteobacteria bacterium SG_bin7]|nr:MAG: hypothetical protein A4S09_09570 [Proteobacteria bacterium SG_bin7]